MPQNKQIYILGLGNILCGDDGFGCHVIALLQENYSFPSNVTLIDAGTQGQLLGGILHESDYLLIIDAADFDEPPGTLFEKSHKQIPAWLGMGKLSAHQGSFAEALAYSQLLGNSPSQIHLIGFQPVQMQFGDKLSAICQNLLPAAVEISLKWIKKQGIYPTPHVGKPLIHPELRASFLAINHT